MQPLIDYLLALDALKSVNRRNYTTQLSKDTPRRLENSAEHSWHLAMACWAVAQHFNLQVNHEKLLKLALVHDLGEIEAGDTFLYADKRSQAHIDERIGVEKLAAMTGNPVPELLTLWDEQETGDSVESKLLKVVDRLLPFMLNTVTDGGAWTDHQVKRSQVGAAQAFISEDFPEIHDWITGQIAIAVQQGWLIED
nr:HD domain-containing protein [Moraxella sp. CTOTU47618]